MPFASVSLLGSPEPFGEARLPGIRDDLIALAATLAAQARALNLWTR
jgi:hypothetical protein